MRRTVAVAGPRRPDLAWQRYVEMDRWSSWAPQITGVEPAQRLAAGLAGVVHVVGGLRIPFTVLEVDEAQRAWSWQVRVGPWWMTLHHEVLADARGGSVATLSVEAVPPLALLYPETARLALHRLVH